MKGSLRDKLNKETVLLDGAFGTYLQSLGVADADYGDRPGCMEYLSVTRPDLVSRIHKDYLEAGSDAVETNTFGGNALKLAEYGLEGEVFDLNLKATKLAREAADEFSTASFSRYVVGTMGPTGKLPSSSDPSLGDVGYVELKKIFREQASAIIKGGADAILVETGQDLLEMKAAVNAAKEAADAAKRDLVIMAQFTLANNGRMLLGTEASAVMAVLGYMGVDVIGVNCSMGPLEMENVISQLSLDCPTFVSCVPNAGLPSEVDGRTVYPLGPEEMAGIMSRFVKEYRLDVIGGCCGTNPEHIKAIREALVSSPKREKKSAAYCASFYQGFDLGELSRPVIVGERMNAQGSRRMKDLLLEEDYDQVVELGKTQQREGARMLDLCSVLAERQTEKRDTVILTKRLAESVNVPLMIDSTDAEVMEAALREYPGTAFINSVNLEDGGEKARHVFALAKEHAGFVVALAIDEKGMAKTVKQKVGIARKLHDIAAKEYGLEPSRLAFDMLTFSLGTGEEEYRDAAVNTFEAIKLLKKKCPGVMTVLGVSNISFGLSKQARRVLNAVFLHYAVEAGLDLAIANPSVKLDYKDIPEEDRKISEDLIFNRHAGALNDLVEHFSGRTVEEAPYLEKADLSVEEKLKKCLFDRNKSAVIPLVEEALKTMKAEDIINDILLDGMRQIGDKLESGDLVLPYVLQSAEVMRKAVEHLQKALPKDHAHKRGTVLLATVFGDVHDIGKNLVRMILKNNGYKVIDLGKQVPVEKIIEEAKKHKVDAVGLSALLVSTARHMKTCVQSLHEADLHYPLLIGGAPVNREFAHDISFLGDKSVYKGGVFYAKDAFTGLKIMQTLTDPDEKKKAMEEYYGQFQKGKSTDGDAISGTSQALRVSGDRKRGAGGNIPKPPFCGLRTVSGISADDVFGYLDEKTLFNLAWGSKLKDRAKKEQLVEKEYKPLLRELKEECLRKGWLDLKAVYGYFKCSVSGEDMSVLGDDGGLIETIHFARSGDGARSLTDYFAKEDLAIFQAVTVGEKINKALSEMDEKEEYSRIFYLHGLSVHLAEALAAYVHDRIRRELGLKTGQGKRYSPGYPLWRNIEDQRKVFKILKAEERIGISLTEACQIVPEQSTTAMVVHSDRAEY